MPLSKNDLETYLARYADCGRMVQSLATILLSLPDPLEAGRQDVKTVVELGDILKAAVRLAKVVRPVPRRVY